MKQKTHQRKVDIGPIEMQARFEPKSINEEERTVEMVFATGHRVRRMRFFDEDFMEELSLDPNHVRLDRLERGAPFLKDHNSFSIDNVLGVLEDPSVDGKRGKIKVRFATDEESERAFQKVKSGILRNVSVGYRVHKFEELEKKSKEGLTVFRAVDWEPFEVSLVAIPADPQSQIRKDEAGLSPNTCDIIQRKDDAELENKDSAVENNPTIEQDKNASSRKTPLEASQMTPEEKAKQEREAKEAQAKRDAELQTQAKQDEKKRQSEIRSIVTKCGLDAERATEWIDQDKTIEEVRTLAIDAVAEMDKKEPTRSAQPQIEVTKTQVEKVRTGVQDALEHKVGASEKLTDAGREFRSMGLLNMASEVLRSEGVEVRNLTRSQLADIALNNKVVGIRGGAHSTSDFPLILANVANKSLRRAYEMAPRTYEPFTTEAELPDFKPVSRVQLGEGEKLEEVPEGGQIRRGTVSESAESYSLVTFAKIISVTRRMLVNDDLSAFNRIPTLLGNRAADLLSDLVWGEIIANENMADGNPLFDAAHGNLGTAGAPSETTLAEMRRLMRLQVGLDGQKINIAPRWLFVPPSLETVAEKLIATVTPDSSANVSPFSRAGRTPLQLAVEARLEDDSASAWYGSADKSQIDMIELGFLEGENGPVIESRDGFDVEGMEIKVRLDAQAKSMDHRGLFKNNG